MKAANRIVKNTGILYARMGITVFISLYSTRLILDSLGATDFGIFNLIAGSIAMLTFLNNAMSTATQRFMSYAQGAGEIDKLKTIFNVSLVLHAIVALGIFVLIEIAGQFLFGGFLNIPEARVGAAKMIFQFAILSTIFSVISVPYDAVINAHENMWLFAVLGIAEAFAKLAIAWYLRFTEFDQLETYGFLTACTSIILLLVRRVYCHRKYVECTIKIKKYFDQSVFREVSQFAAWSFLGCFTSMFSYYGQGVVLNMFFGTKVNAAQGISTQVSGQLSAFSSTMLKALNPHLAKSEGAGNRQDLLSATITGSKMSVFLLLLFYIPVFIEMPYIFGIWLKNVPEYAIVFCRLLLLRNIFEQLFITINSTITAAGDIRKYQIYTSLLTVLPLIVSYCLFKFGYNPPTIYYVYLVYSLANFLTALYFVHRICGLPYKVYFSDVLKKCLLVGIVATLAALIPYKIFEQGLLRLIAVGLTSVAALFLAVWLIGLTKGDRKEVAKIFATIKGKISTKRRVETIKA